MTDPRRCPDHPAQPIGACHACRAEWQAADHETGAALVRAALAAKAAMPQRTEHRNPVADARLNPEELEAARARLDREDQP